MEQGLAVDQKAGWSSVYLWIRGLCGAGFSCGSGGCVEQGVSVDQKAVWSRVLLVVARQALLLLKTVLVKNKEIALSSVLLRPVPESAPQSPVSVCVCMCL